MKSKAKWVTIALIGVCSWPWMIKPVPWRLGVNETNYGATAWQGIPIREVNTDDPDPEWKNGEILADGGKVYCAMEIPYKIHHARRMEKAFREREKKSLARGIPAISGREGDVAYYVFGEKPGQRINVEKVAERLVFNLKSDSAGQKITTKPRILAWFEICVIDFCAKFKI